MYREYDAQLLRKVQMTEKKILEKFISICEKHELKYFAVFGTLLGTIRHKGFIPWDDDIDVGMPRRDYEKFLKVAQEECGDEYFLQTIDTDPEYHLYFAKLRMNGTEFVEDTLQDAGSVTGFYIDIFPYDIIPNDEKEWKKHMKRAVFYGMLLSVNKVKEPQIARGNAIVNLVKSVVWAILHYGMKLLGVKGKCIWEQCMQAMTKYENTNNQRLTTFAADASKWIVYDEEIRDVEELAFEDIVIATPKGYDAILRRNYGDYMQMPPEEQRVNHMPVKIRFSDEKDIVFSEES